MRRLLFVLVCTFVWQQMVMADNDKPIRVDQLPQVAQTFIKKHFANAKIALAKKETELFDKSYEVIFTNGDKIEFDKKGNWKEVDCKYTSVPWTAIPTGITKYINENYHGNKVLKMEKDKKEYEVKLSNRIELKFDLFFNLTDIDH